MWMGADEAPGLEMLQLKSMTKAGTGRDSIDRTSTEDADNIRSNNTGPPKCKYCKYTKYTEMTQVVECALPNGGGTFKVLVKARSWIKNLGRYVEWVNPHEMEKLDEVVRMDDVQISQPSEQEKHCL